MFTCGEVRRGPPSSLDHKQGTVSRMSAKCWFYVVCSMTERLCML